MFKEYKEYIRDNPEGYWFKRKLYGWGWTPVRWQGWVTTIIFIILIVLYGSRLDAVSHLTSDTIRPFLIQTIALVLILFAICYWKGEPPRWQWGQRKKPSQSIDKTSDIPALDKLKEEDLVYFGYRVEPYFASNIILSGMLNRKALKEIFDWDIGVRWIQVNYYFFQFKADMARVETELKDSLQTKGLSYVDRVVNQCLKYGAQLLKVSRELGANYSQTDDKQELAKGLEQYFAAMTRYTTFYSMALFERPLMELAQTVAKRNASGPEVEPELFDLISTSSRETAVEREQEDFLKLASVDQKDKSNLAEAHAEKYGWLAIRFFVGQPWTAGDILSRLKGIDSKTAALDLENRLQRRQKREEKIEQAIQPFSPEDKEVVKQIREIVFLRNERADFYNESAYHARPLLEKIALVLGVSYTDLINLCASEIALALKGEFEDFREHIQKRKEALFVYHNGDYPFIIDGEEAKVYLREKPFLLPGGESAKEVTGKVGYKGKAKGIVRIVKLGEDISKVRSGDVLITPMTIPNFIPAMERAVAFVTDEGGITCHAAIIAREMHKPCVVGTKIATQIFKDGDLVEVDAEKGIVKVL